jgi:integrase
LASSWIIARTLDGNPPARRYLPRYRLGGKHSEVHYGGSFKTRREAILRCQFIDGEIAAGRVPTFNLERAETPARTLAQAADHYRASRVDAADNTNDNMKNDLDRIVTAIGRDRRVDQVTGPNIADAIATLAERYKRETIRKSLIYLGALLEFEGIDPNPAKDKRYKRLPPPDSEEADPPPVEHVEAVWHLLPSKHLLPLFWLDHSAARAQSVDCILVSDYDEPERRVRLRRSWMKTRRDLWVYLSDVLAEAIEETLGPREDRDPDARLFADSGSAALRTAIAKACKAAGIPRWSPHDLKHRRVSVMHREGRTWAEIAELTGNRSLKLLADTYTHLLVDGREVDYAALLAARNPGR